MRALKELKSILKSFEDGSIGQIPKDEFYNSLKFVYNDIKEKMENDSIELFDKSKIKKESEFIDIDEKDKDSYLEEEYDLYCNSMEKADQKPLNFKVWKKQFVKEEE